MKSLQSCCNVGNVTLVLQHNMVRDTLGMFMLKNRKQGGTKCRRVRCVTKKQTGIFFSGTAKFSFMHLWLKVYDHIHVIQCYRCQEYGHYASSDICKEKHSAYFYCAKSDHKSKDCPIKKDKAQHRCINCKHSRHVDQCHKPTDFLCWHVLKKLYGVIIGLNAVQIQKTHMSSW